MASERYVTWENTLIANNGRQKKNKQMYLRNLRCGIEKCALGFYAAANNVPLGSLCFLYEYARLDSPLLPPVSCLSL